MQVLVTGGSGFIGSELIRQLLNQGIKVRALLRGTSLLHNLAGLDFETVIGDLCDAESLKGAVSDVDCVFHLAGAITGRTRDDFFKHNAVGTANLAKACAEANPNLKRFVYVSSIAAAGPASSQTPRSEKEKEAPVSFYGESKLAGEKELLSVAKFPVSIVRPPAVYGPRDKAILEFVKIVNSGLLPLLPSRTASGDKFYSVVHVEDLVRGIVLAGTKEGQAREEIYFICGDGVFTWKQMMRGIADGLRRKTLNVPLPLLALRGLAAAQSGLSKLLNRPFPLTLDKIKELEADFWVCSNEHAKQKLGFEPRWQMREGLAQTIDWYREQGWI